MSSHLLKVQLRSKNNTLLASSQNPQQTVYLCTWIGDHCREGCCSISHPGFQRTIQLPITQLSWPPLSVPLNLPHQIWQKTWPPLSGSLSQSVPRAKSHSLNPTWSSSDLLHRLLLGLPWFHSVCMHMCIGAQEDSSYRVYRGFHLWTCFLRIWCLYLSDFPFLQKEGIQTGNLWMQMQIKQLLTSLDNVSEEIFEDMQLMRGSHSKMTMILSSGDGFCKRPMWA